MNRSFVKAGTVILLLTPFLLVSSAGAFQTGQANQSAAAAQTTEKQSREEAAAKAKLLKSHMAAGNAAMDDARAIRQQLQTATGEQKSALTAKMNADYQTAITEYQEALKNARTAAGDAIQPIGLIRLLRNGLISEQKAVEMEVQDKNIPIILSNLGMAYSGAGDYDDAIPLLQESMVTEPKPATYMQLGTDLAEVGKLPEANAACDKIVIADPSSAEVKGACYRNIAVVLMNHGKPSAAVGPLQQTTEINANDAFAWKLLGDALSSGITTQQEQGKVIYVIPPGTLEAYQKYLQLAPNGPYASQVKSTLDGFAQLTKGEGKTP